MVVTTGDDRLGTLNFATFALAAPNGAPTSAPTTDMNRHNLRVGVNYVSAVRDERAGVQYGENGEEWVTLDATYRFEVTDDLSLTGTIANILDKDPPRAQEELGYDPFMGNSARPDVRDRREESILTTPSNFNRRPQAACSLA